MRFLLSALVALVLLVARPALALVTLSVQTGSQNTVSLGAGDCGAQVTVNFQVQALGTSCDPFEVWATTNSSCRDVPGDNDFIIGTQDVTLQPTGLFTFNVRELPIFTADTACGVEGIERTARICGAYSYAQPGGFGGCGDNPPTDRATTPITVVYDAKPPAVPSIASLTAKDNGLSLRVDAADAVRIRAQIRPSDSTADFVEAATGPTGSILELRNLVNGREYEVRAVAEDSAGNVSDPSAPQLGTPVQTIGFYGSYCRAGGECEGGCGAAVGGPTLLGLLIAVFALQRRKS